MCSKLVAPKQKGNNVKLLDTGNGNTKIKKTATKEDNVRMAQLSMMPDQKLCPSSLNAECFDLCLKHSGLALVYKSVNDARRKKTEFFHGDNKAFLDQLIKELGNFSKLCKKQNVKGVVRLNVLSDVPWEKTAFLNNFRSCFSTITPSSRSVSTKRQKIMS